MLSRIALQELTGQAYVTVEDQATAMAAAILNNAEGYAVVELSELDEATGIWAETDGPFGPRVCRGTRGDSFTYWPSEVARQLGAALIAASIAAEAGA